MKRKVRLQSAKTWIAKYPGKNLIKEYRKHFGVDWFCAIQELQMMEVQINPQYVEQLKRTLESDQKIKQARKQMGAAIEKQDFDPQSDGNFAYIAGTTPNGVPYGVTWEETAKLDDGSDFCINESPLNRLFEK